MFVIAVGNAFDGYKLYGDCNGDSFTDHDDALGIAESQFGGKDWVIIEVHQTDWRSS